jgi:predicted Zn-ribbon and HTH transcriptional regulator
MSANWRIRVGDKVTKPLAPQQVQELLRQKRIPADALISSDGTTWRPIAELKREKTSNESSVSAKTKQRSAHDDDKVRVLVTACCECGWNRTIKTRTEHVGKKTKCPNCHALVTIDLVPATTNDNVTIICARCGSSLTVNRHIAGKEITCDDCGWLSTLPQEATTTTKNPDDSLSGRGDDLAPLSVPFVYIYYFLGILADLWLLMLWTYRGPDYGIGILALSAMAFAFFAFIPVIHLHGFLLYLLTRFWRRRVNVAILRAAWAKGGVPRMGSILLLAVATFLVSQARPTRDGQYHSQLYHFTYFFVVTSGILYVWSFVMLTESLAEVMKVHPMKAFVSVVAAWIGQVLCCLWVPVVATLLVRAWLS